MFRCKGGGVMNRYEVQKSEEGHYKLDYIVIDKAKPEYHCDDVNHEFEPIWHFIVCHCSDEAQANIVCNLLNSNIENRDEVLIATYCGMKYTTSEIRLKHPRARIDVVNGAAINCYEER